MKTPLTILLFFGLSDIAISQEVEINILDTDEFSVAYPTTWEMDNSGQSGTKFIVLSPADGEVDTFRENVNLMVQDLSSAPMSLDDFTELSMTQIMAAGAEVVESEQSGGPVRQKLVFNMVQGSYDLRLIRYYWMVGNKAFVLTLTCLKNENDQYWEAGQRIMDSLKIK